MTRKPPRPAEWLLDRMAKAGEEFSAKGDFQEEFSTILEDRGRLRAGAWYVFQVLIYLPSYLKTSVYWSLIMFRNYLKVALRNLCKHKAYTFINIAGLAAGLTACILILLWVQDELSFDGFHEKADTIYRITWKENNEEKYSVVTPAPLADVIKEECPEIVNSTRYASSYQDMPFKYKDKSFEFRASFADSRFASIFSFPFLYGDPNTALDDPLSLVITEEIAHRLFAREIPIGKVLTLRFWDNQEYDLKVTGVIQNIPHNSHLQTKSFISMNFWTVLLNRNDWSDNFTNTYLLIRENQQIRNMEAKIGDVIQKYKRFSGQTGPQVYLQPLKSVHLYSDFRWDISGHGDIKYVHIFLLIGLFILLIACVNYMNLSTARSMTRSKEIGLRKVIGANRAKISVQFISESFLYIASAFIISVISVEILLPHFSKWTGKELAINYLNWQFVIGAILIGLFTGIVAAVYPAFVLSAFEPTETLKQSPNLAPNRNAFRKSLVALQFSLSIIIIIGSIVVSKQLNYMRNANLGYNRDNLIYIKMQGGMNAAYETVKLELQQNPYVINTTANEFITRDIRQGTDSIVWEGKQDDEDVNMQVFRIDYDFLKTYQIEMAEGRFYSKEFATDATEAYVINEAAVKAMGMTSPVGRQFSLWKQNGKIIGVIKDFHFKSLHDEIEPMILWPNTTRNFRGFSYLTIRLKSGNLLDTMRSIESLWKKHSPDHPFEYHFFDETLDAHYRSELRMGKIFIWFSFLASFISCLGLLGLVSFIVKQKTKEIGVRKVLGASIPNIVGVLLKDFTGWILPANLIAWPIAYLVMDKWLQNFAYRTEISLWIFASAGGLALLIALLSVGWQAIRAATANPVHSLRNE